MQQSLLGKLMVALSQTEPETSGLPRPATEQATVSTLSPLEIDNSKLKTQNSKLVNYPPAEKWDDWTEYDPKAWPRKVQRRYTLVPTVCFNCESACGLLGYVDKDTLKIQKFE